MVNFPTSLDSFTNPSGTDKLNSPSHSDQHTDENDAIEALEAKVGADGSAVTSSHDYKLSGVTGTDKAASKDGTETLTNKTLTSPTINTPTIDTPTIRNFDGWLDANQTWTYASATTFTISGDYTSLYSVGDKIRLKQGGAYKYFYIVGVSYSSPNTTVTVTGGDDYSVANAAITDNYYSKAETPTGFPQWFAWTPAYTGGTGGGSIGTITTNIARFSMDGKTVHIIFACVLTVTGTVNWFYINLPVTSDDDYVRGSSVRGTNSLAVVRVGSGDRLYFYNNGGALLTGAWDYATTITYEAN